MPPKKQNRNSGISSKENDPSLLNRENLTTQMNTGHLKPMNEIASQDSKLNKASRNSSNASTGKQPKDKKEAPSDQKDQAKPVIKEKPDLSPPKDWNEEPQPLELGFTENLDLIVNDEKNQVYEEHFPTLGGNDLEVSKPETAFSTEILSPTNVARSQVLKEITDSSSIMMNEEDKQHQNEFMEESLPPEMNESKGLESSKEKITTEWEKNAPEPTPQTAPIQDETPVEEEKVEQYETHFPALGEEQPEVAKPETEFTPELLEPKLIAEEVVEVQPENPISYLIHDDKKPKEASESVERTISTEDTKVSEWEKNTPESTRPIISKDDITPASEEKIEVYESHFPALGEAPEVAKPESEFSTEILEPKVVAEEVVEVQPVNLIPVLSHEEPMPEITTTSRGQSTIRGDYISVDKQVDKSTQLDTIAHPSRSHVEIHNEVVQENTEKESLSTMEVQDEPFTLTAENKGRESPETFGGQLASEIEQIAQAEEIENQDNEELYEGEEQRQKQDEQLQEEAAMAEPFKSLVEEILRVAEDENRAGAMKESWVVISSQTHQAPAFEENDEERHKGYKPIKQDIADQEELESLIQRPGDVDDQPDAEEEYGNIRVDTQKTMKYAEQLEAPKGKSAPRAESKSKFQSVREKSDESLEPIEEKIVSEDEGVNLQDVIKPSLEKVKETERKRSLNEMPDTKLYAKSSLEHLAEDQTEIQSTMATLSSQRIDLIKEEIKTIMGEPTKNDLIFSDAQKNLDIVKGLEKSRMYGAAINLLKKNIETLDTRIVRHDEFNVEEMNRLLVESNTECSYCYSHVSEHKLAIDYARAALNLNPNNIKAIYLLGSNLLKAGDQIGGYKVLKEARRILYPAEHETYYKLIEIELQKCESRAIEVERELESILRKPGTPLGKKKSVTIDIPAQEEERERPANEVLGRLGVFTGAAGLSGLVSWIATKNYFDMPTRKSAAISVGIGAFIGGLSLFVMTHLGGRTKSNK